MFPKNEEEMGQALIALGHRLKKSEARWERFRKYWYSSPQYQRLQEQPRRHYGDEFNPFWNAWLAWNKDN